MTATAVHSRAPPQPPRRRRLSPRVHHITASRTTPTHTHPCSTHLNLHRTHLTLTATPATRSPHPLHRARAPADTYLVPARSPRKTRPSRRPPRSARPLVRPTSFMRTTTPRSPPAKAPRTMSRLRCAQSQHECEQGAHSLPPRPVRRSRCQLDVFGPRAMIAPAFTPSAWHVLAMQPSSPNELTAERWYAAICRPQVHSDKTPATALTSTAYQSDETPATALTSTAYQSDETYSSELATINGKPGSLYQHHERNASAASSEQVIASSTEWRPRRALSARATARLSHL